MFRYLTDLVSAPSGGGGSFGTDEVAFPCIARVVQGSDGKLNSAGRVVLDVDVVEGS
jgi:hypothetical protein